MQLRAQITLTNFFNFETAPVHPIALSPDSSKLAVCNLPDGRLEFLDPVSGVVVTNGSVPVGIDPVTVRFRSAAEAWVANYISDSISIVDVPTMRVVATLSTSNEPSDIVFAGSPERAYVSCGQPNLVQVFNPATLGLVTNVIIDGNRPRGLAVSPDGTKVYAAIFESGNRSTIIGNGVSEGFPRPNPINFPNAPSGGMNPSPNSGTNFLPAINSGITSAPPRVSLIVRKNAAGKWMDDNNGDWTEYITGTNAAFTGRSPGWDLPDHDLAVINTSNLQVSYATGLMNICMAAAVNPASGKITVVGTDAVNSTRFQSVLNGTFIRVNFAQVDPATLATTISDLNSHLTYASSSTTQTERDKSIGDPRAIVWNSAGTRGYVSGMGSDNLIVIDASGNRVGPLPVIPVDAGPTGIALDETRHRLYVYNRFAGNIVTVSTDSQTVLTTNRLFDPTPQPIKLGRPHLYSTHQTSGLGQAACASCHVDSRFDRLAWDLGEPDDVMKFITNGFNFGPAPPGATNHFHPMKGPMVTQTLQDIITHEPFHWRGDRDGIEQFDGTFTNLQGAATGLATNEMQDLKNFLSTLRFAPNPFRAFDNSLPTNMPLPGHIALGRGALPAGSLLPNGNAVLGQGLFRTNTSQGCLPCHTLPTGLGTDLRFVSSWTQIPPGPASAHHIQSIELERNSNLPFKIPSLRNMFDKFGLDFAGTASRAGFGFGHDGSVDSLVRFVQDGFGFTNDQATANITAFLLSFTGSDLIPGNAFDVNRSPGVASLDTPASVGRQLTLSNSTAVALLDAMVALANSSTGRVDLIAKGFKSGLGRGWFLDRTTGQFIPDRQSESSLTPASLRALASAGAEQTYTLVPRGAGRRLGIDRDNDGYLDRDELDFGSDPADPLSLATNTPPKLGAVSNVTTLKGRLLTLTFSAVDTDVPVQQLIFSLGTNAPVDATINPTNGVLTWTPSGSSNLITNFITVIVTDNGNPNRSDSNTLTIVAADLSILSTAAATNGFSIQWSALPGISYRLQYKNSLADSNWSNVAGDVATTNAVATKVDPSAATNVSRFYRLVALP